MAIRRFMMTFLLVTVAVVALPSAAFSIEVVAGSTWYSDGTRHKSGPPGTVISAYAVGALPGVPYKLVLALDNDSVGGQCVTTVQELNATVVSTGSSGVIGRVRGTVAPGTPRGTYILCFKDSSMFQSTNTGGATFRVE
jgi:hypothetical protein